MGESVVGGTRLGYVGSTGNATGPHLHFEVRLNGTPIDPLPYMLPSTAVRAASTWRCPPGKPRNEGRLPDREGRALLKKRTAPRSRRGAGTFAG